MGLFFTLLPQMAKWTFLGRTDDSKFLPEKKKKTRHSILTLFWGLSNCFLIRFLSPFFVPSKGLG